jgi:citronellol/citronellal dehydrogenase
VEIVADAAFYILQKPSFETTGNFFIDEDVLKKEGVTDFSKYAVNPDHKLMNDLFL